MFLLVCYCGDGQRSDRSSPRCFTSCQTFNFCDGSELWALWTGSSRLHPPAFVQAPWGSALSCCFTSDILLFHGATLRDFIFLFLPAGEQQTVDWDQFCEHFAQFDLRWMFERRVEICIWIIGPCWRESSCLWEHLDERDLKTFRQYLWLKHWRFFSSCSSVAVTDRHVLSADHNRTSPPEVRVHLITLYRLYCPH